MSPERGAEVDATESNRSESDTVGDATANDERPPDIPASETKAVDRRRQLLAAAARAGVVVVTAVAFVVIVRWSTVFARAVTVLVDHAALLLFASALVVAATTWLPSLEPLRQRRASAAAAWWLHTAGLAGSICAGMTPALTSWREGRWSYSKIAGVVPWSDASAYHVGGIKLLHDGVLDRFTGRRPLNAGFYAVRMAVTGSDFWLALLLQGALVGVAIYVLVRLLAARTGSAGALLAAGLLVTFAADSVDTTLSEPLGLMLGSLAACALMIGVMDHHRWMTGCGVFLLAVALNVRAGAYFVLPLALLALVIDRRSGSRFDVRGASVGLAAVVAGFAMSVPISAAFSDGSASLNGNFSYTLYGLAHGGTGWGSAQQAFDRTAYATERELTDAIYRAAFEQIRAHPFELVRGIWHGYDEFFDSGVFGFVADPWDSILLMLLILGAAAALRRERRDAGVFFVLVVLGILASVPFIFQDGGYRVFAATMPVLAVLPAIGMSALCRRASGGLDGGVDRWESPAPAPITARMIGRTAAVATAVLLIGPFLVVAVARDGWGDTPLACSPDRLPVVGELSRRTPHVTVVDDVASAQDFGELAFEPYASGARSSFNEVGSLLQDVTPGQTVAMMWNELPAGPPIVIVTLPTDVFERLDGRVELCGVPDPTQPPLDYAYVSVREVERAG